MDSSEMGRRGGLARAAKMTAEELSEHGRKAVQARWKKAKKAKQKPAKRRKNKPL